MIRLSATGLKKEFGTDVLFENISFHIEEQQKIGLVGVNGAGKTTLFKMLTGEATPTEGELFFHKQTRVGYLQQMLTATDKPMWDEAISVFSDLLAIEAELETLRLQLEQCADEALIRRQHDLQTTYEDRGGFVFRSKLKGALMGLGFSEKEFSTPFSSLSGGQKTRVMLCKILLSDANLLLLDEPTNHLDIPSTMWLESFLQDYKGSVLVISHDRYFLDRVTNTTFELENKHLTVYKGNYTRYLALKEEQRAAAEKKYLLTKKEIGRVEAMIEQQRRWGREKNIKTAENKQKMVDRLEATLEKPEDAPDKIYFEFNTKSGGGNDVLTLSGLAKAYGEKRLFSRVDMDIKKGQRVFLLGANGCGKTTLLKILMGQETADGGTFQFGTGIERGYYDQAQSGLNPDKTVIDEVWDAFPTKTQTQIRNSLAVFLFRGDDVYKPISALSGGEKARVLLLKLMLSSANLLVLDEPTNHLDIWSKEALEEALAGYEGTLLVVSHDRYFIDKTADKIYYMDDGGVTEYNGNYSYFLEKSAGAAPQQAQAEKKPNAYREQKERESALRRLQGKISRAEQAVEALEEEIAALEEALADPAIAADYVKVATLAEEIRQKKEAAEEQMLQWEAWNEELEAYDEN